MIRTRVESCHHHDPFEMARLDFLRDFGLESLAYVALHGKFIPERFTFIPTSNFPSNFPTSHEHHGYIFEYGFSTASTASSVQRCLQLDYGSCEW